MARVIFDLTDLIYQTLDCHSPWLLLMRNRGLSGGGIKRSVSLLHPWMMGGEEAGGDQKSQNFVEHGF